MENWMLGTVGITAIIGLWSYIKNFFLRIKRLVVLDVEFESGYASIAVSGYIREHFKDSSLNPRKYIAYNLLLKSSEYEVIPMKRITGGTSVFWNGWFPISVSNVSEKKEGYLPIKISYIKGTLDIEELFRKATENYNHVSKRMSSSRFFIKHLFGSAGQKGMLSAEFVKGTEVSSCRPVNYNDTTYFVENTLLKYKFEDFGNAKVGNGIANIALPKNAELILEDIEKWMKSKTWFLEKGITWKRGYGLYGEPGTGKTSFIRSIAEEYDLPVFVFDLFSLRNEELKEKWNQLLSNTPCIALFEDIDTVFDGRKSMNEELSFDSFLNCLDGVQRNNGILTFITTNNIDKVDDALKNRPGRIDRLIEMTKLTKDERLKIVSRILKDFPDSWNTVLDCDLESGADCEKKCLELANKLYWEKND